MVNILNSIYDSWLSLMNTIVCRVNETVCESLFTLKPPVLILGVPSFTNIL